jgi:hypothetical protein
MGTAGWVELRKNSPLRLNSEQFLSFGSGRGRLTSRAAPGVTPVIEVTHGGLQPFLQTGSAVLLELSGLTFIVRYAKPIVAFSATNPPQPLISAAGKTTKIEHCAFKLIGNPGPKDSCAIFSNGGALEVDRCWFEGFDRAIEINAVDRIPARIQQTMIVPAPDQSQSAEPRGWGVKFLTTSSAASRTELPQGRLILDHCTFEGAGLLDLTGSTIKSPLPIEVNHCAVRAEALLACKPNQPVNSLANLVLWLGSGNQYDIRGQSWIVLSANSERTPGLSFDIIDLDSWLRVATKDQNVIRTKLEFVSDSAPRSDSFPSRDFAIKASGTLPTQGKAGADPELVGPWGKR